jgi:DNA-binding MarR family transcriptional regulator
VVNRIMRVAVGQAFDLTRDEIWFLKALRAAGERGRIVSVPASRAALVRLVEVQYVTTHPQSERRTLYIITDRGRQALANAPQ